MVAEKEATPAAWEAVGGAGIQIEKPQFNTGLVEDWKPPTDDIPTSFLSDCVLSFAELNRMEIPPRECFVGTWLRQAGSGFVFAPRGLGKTWFTLNLAVCLAEGRDCGPWVIPKARRVMVIDGEMHLDALRERLRNLSQKPDAPLHALSHEVLFRNQTRGLDLAEPDAQEAVTAECARLGVDVLILDNLSCLFYGVRENEADDWEQVQPWLLQLRNKGIAVVIVHHAGRNGQMRGTSKREGPATFVLSLTAPGAGDERSGAHFISAFTKNREGDPRKTNDEEGPWLWHFEPETDDRVKVMHERLSSLDRFVGLVRDGLTSCKDIAEEMGVSKGAVSKWAKKATLQNPPLIKIESDGRYLPAD